MKKIFILIMFLVCTSSVFAEFVTFPKNHPATIDTNRDFSNTTNIKTLSYCHVFSEAQEYLATTYIEKRFSFEKVGNAENIEIEAGKYPDIEAQNFRYKVIELNKDCLPFVLFIIDSYTSNIWVAKEIY